MKDHAIPIIGGTGVTATIYALAEFSIHNLDILMAALGPLAFRVAPIVPYMDEKIIQKMYIALAVLSAILAVWTLAKRARKRFL